MVRDIRTQPYNADEKRVCDYIQKISNRMVGCGEDPIGFLIASHGSLMRVIDELKVALRVNVLRTNPNITHDQITMDINKIVDNVMLASDPKGLRKTIVKGNRNELDRSRRGNRSDDDRGDKHS